MSRIRFLIPAVALALLVTLPLARAQYASSQTPSDPPDRVARLAYLSGDVEFAPAGENTWGSASLNRPLITGDRLLTGGDGRAALELGDAALRIDHDSAFNFLDLSSQTAQVELSQGTLNLRVRRYRDAQTYEIDTPAIAFVAGEPGAYRVDVAPDGNGAIVTVFDGTGTVYGENGVSREVAAGQSYRFNDSQLRDVAVTSLPRADDFDRFCSTRDDRYAHSISRRYVSPDVIGYDDLDDYGDWQETPTYGEVWYPNRVASDWVPYRDGHWTWVEPWGWTWVDDQPWGFAPAHYGRWAYIRDRWGWVPGPRIERAVYAPALVAFIGGSGLSLSINLGGGEPVGWFPLGPRDVYLPSYPVSRGYFNEINVTNIRVVNQTIINNDYDDYAANRHGAGRSRRHHYAYRDDPRASTLVPRGVFAGARPVRPAVLHLDRARLSRARIAVHPHVNPVRASLGVRSSPRQSVRALEAAFRRPLIARHMPPPSPVAFATRAKLIAKRGGAPLPIAQLRQLRQAHVSAEPRARRIRLAAAKRGPLPRRPAEPVSSPRPRGVITRPAARRQPPYSATAVRPIRAPIPRATPQRAAPLRPGELRSARFAHRPETAGLPRPPKLRTVAKSAAPTRAPVRPAAPRSDRMHGAVQTPRTVRLGSRRGDGFMHAPRANRGAPPAARRSANTASTAQARKTRQAQTQRPVVETRQRNAQTRVQPPQRAAQTQRRAIKAHTARSRAKMPQRAAQAHQARGRDLTRGHPAQSHKMQLRAQAQQQAAHTRSATAQPRHPDQPTRKHKRNNDQQQHR